jgi:hypothetical protein
MRFLAKQPPLSPGEPGLHVLALVAVPSYQLEERDSTWLVQAPLVVFNEVSVPASSAQVFAVLADIGNWQA